MRSWMENVFRRRFVTMPDGRTAFFPLGQLSVFTGAYVISSAEAARLRRLLAINWRVCFWSSILVFLLIQAVHLIYWLPSYQFAQLFVWAFWLLTVPFTVSHYALIAYVLHGPRPPPARLSRRESMIVQARLHDQALLIVRMLLFIVFFVGVAVLVIFLNHVVWPIAVAPTVGPMAAAVIVFGCFGAACYAAILVAKRSIGPPA